MRRLIPIDGRIDKDTTRKMSELVEREIGDSRATTTAGSRPPPLSRTWRALAAPTVRGERTSTGCLGGDLGQRPRTRARSRRGGSAGRGGQPTDAFARPDEIREETGCQGLGGGHPGALGPSVSGRTGRSRLVVGEGRLTRTTTATAPRRPSSSRSPRPFTWQETEVAVWRLTCVAGPTADAASSSESVTPPVSAVAAAPLAASQARRRSPNTFLCSLSSLRDDLGP